METPGRVPDLRCTKSLDSNPFFQVVSKSSIHPLCYGSSLARSRSRGLGCRMRRCSPPHAQQDLRGLHECCAVFSSLKRGTTFCAIFKARSANTGKT